MKCTTSETGIAFALMEPAIPPSTGLVDKESTTIGRRRDKNGPLPDGFGCVKTESPIEPFPAAMNQQVHTSASPSRTAHRFQRRRLFGRVWPILPVFLVQMLFAYEPYVQVGDFLIQTFGPYSNDPTMTCYIERYTGSGSVVNIPSILIGYTVKGVSDSAFKGCTQMTIVTFPDTATGIGSQAFAGCTGLASIDIPDSVNNLWADAFDGCANLTSINIGAANTTYASVSGVLFNKSKTELMVVPGGLSGSYAIPGSVTTIGGRAFAGCARLSDVTIPGSVTTIGSQAFMGCTGLTGMTIPGNVTAIGSMAFENCTRLTHVTIPNSVTTIDGAAFRGCTALTDLASVTFPGSVTAIADSMFENCTGLTNASISGSITAIGYDAFSGCTGLTRVTIPASVTSIGQGAFAGCAGLPGIVVGSGVTNIGAMAFTGCAGLKNVTIPNSVTTLGGGAFMGCTGLTGVTIPGSVTTLGGGAFMNCSSLTRAVFVGDAPALGAYYQYVFSGAAGGFAAYYFKDRTGFTSPPWSEADFPFPLICMGDSSPVAFWLLANGLPYDADLQSAPNGDGVPLLMAYALNLDPTRNQRGSLPVPKVSGNQFQLSFYAGSTGITYSVETSTNLHSWTTSGVLLSNLDANQCRTASVVMDRPCRFLRFVVRK